MVKKLADVAAHPAGNNLFTAGQPASANLQAMAEGGSISGLSADVTALGATVVENPAGGLLAPASSTTFNVNTDGTSNDRLSLVAMLLPTNDVATELGNPKMANMVALGGYIERVKPLSLDCIKEVLPKVFPERLHKIIPLNEKAIETGAEMARRG